ncbi:hypothetical protein ScalyP_jg628 [Parmales sp. scaly parma]|nr:hypothetical protein ScalyP_jg628 [Parmales sp. scaly parma]
MMVSDILDEVHHPILATRVNEELWNEMLEVEEGNGVECSFDKNNYSLTYNKVANVVVLKPPPLPCDTPAAPQLSHVCVVTAGTTDIPVAEEAIAILEASNVKTTRVFDCGVAGLHRILNALPTLTDDSVQCVIVCAGMDGALPSVVAGLIKSPVVAVPTSIGYGASFNGVAALLTMLNSCAPGVAVVNIDGGFSAAAMAHKIVAQK